MPERWSLLTKRSISYSRGDLRGGGVGVMAGPRNKQCYFQNTNFSPQTGQFQVQVCLVTERAIS